MKAIILAGGLLDESLAKETGRQWRCELPYKGRQFLDIVLDAMPGEVTVIGGPPRHDVEWQEGGDRFIESFARGVQAGGQGRFLMASADLPFLTRESVMSFVGEDDQSSAIQYPIVEMGTMRGAYGNMPRTTLKLREGEFTGGNLFLLDGQAMEAILPRMQQAYEARKNVLKLGRLLGFPTLLSLVQTKVFPGTVGIPQLETHVGKALRAKVRAVISTYPELAADIDSPEHFAWLKTL